MHVFCRGYVWNHIDGKSSYIESLHLRVLKPSNHCASAIGSVQRIEFLCVYKDHAGFSTTLHPGLDLTNPSPNWVKYHMTLAVFREQHNGMRYDQYDTANQLAGVPRLCMSSTEWREVKECDSSWQLQSQTKTTDKTSIQIADSKNPISPNYILSKKWRQ